MKDTSVGQESSIRAGVRLWLALARCRPPSPGLLGRTNSREWRPGFPPCSSVGRASGIWSEGRWFEPGLGGQGRHEVCNADELLVSGHNGTWVDQIAKRVKRRP